MKREASVRIVDFGSLRALIDVRFDLMEIRGFKVIDRQDEDGAWVSFPSREILRDGKKEAYSVVRFPKDEAGKAARKEFHDWILSCYRTALEKR